MAIGFSRATAALARDQGIRLGAASETIGALVDKLLLKRTRDKADRRGHDLALTAKAERLIRTDPIQSLVVAAFALGDNERTAMADGLEKMLAHLLHHEGSSYFGYCGDSRFLQCARRGGRKPYSYRCSHLEQGLPTDDLIKICINFGPAGLAPDP